MGGRSETPRGHRDPTQVDSPGNPSRIAGMTVCRMYPELCDPVYLEFSFKPIGEQSSALDATHWGVPAQVGPDRSPVLLSITSYPHRPRDGPPGPPVGALTKRRFPSAGSSSTAPRTSPIPNRSGRPTPDGKGGSTPTGRHHAGGVLYRLETALKARSGLETAGPGRRLPRVPDGLTNVHRTPSPERRTGKVRPAVSYVVGPCPAPGPSCSPTRSPYVRSARKHVGRSLSSRRRRVYVSSVRPDATSALRTRRLCRSRRHLEVPLIWGDRASGRTAQAFIQPMTARRLGRGGRGGRALFGGKTSRR